MSKKINSRLKKAVPTSPTNKQKDALGETGFIKNSRVGNKAKEELLGLTSQFYDSNGGANEDLQISGNNPSSPKFEIDFNTG